MKISYLISKLIQKTHIPAVKNSKIDVTSKISSNTNIVNSSIKKYTYIGNDCTVIEANIGSFCSIANNTVIGGASHPINWVSTSPVFHNGKNILKKNFSKHNFNPYETTEIGNDVWVGNNCLIKGGVIIETGAILGMGSVLTKNIGPYEIWAGNPAEFIRYRFEKEEIRALIESKWWEWSEDELKSKVSSFDTVSTFIHQIKGETHK